jgi:hypothetical protein
MTQLQVFVDNEHNGLENIRVWYYRQYLGRNYNISLDEETSEDKPAFSIKLGKVMNQNYVYNKSKGMFVFKLLSRA